MSLYFFLAHLDSFKTVTSEHQAEADGAQKPECTLSVHEDFEHQPIPDHVRAVSLERIYIFKP